MSKVTSLTALVFLFISSVANSAVPVTENEAVLFYGYDALGSPITTSDEQGRVLWYESSRPYGQSLKRVNVQGEGFGDNFDEGAVSRLGYTGHQSDSGTGLIYMRARYYDPQVGRFYGNDPVGFEVDNPMMFNRYAYANNNPYLFVDPDGRNATMYVAGFFSEAAEGLLGIGDGSFDFQEYGLGALADGYNGEGQGFAAAFTSDVSAVLDIFSVGGASKLNAAVEVISSKAVTKIGDRFTKEVVKRGKPGRDGGQSQHVIEKVNGQTTSTTHQVVNDGKLIHQHQDHFGKNGTVRRFADELTGTKTIDAAKLKDTMTGGRLGFPPGP